MFSIAGVCWRAISPACGEWSTCARFTARRAVSSVIARLATSGWYRKWSSAARSWILLTRFCGVSGVSTAPHHAFRRVRGPPTTPVRSFTGGSSSTGTRWSGSGIDARIANTLCATWRRRGGPSCPASGPRPSG